MKLVVTGHDEKGGSVFSHAGEAPRSAGPGSFDLWATDRPLSVPDSADPAQPASIGYFPVAGQTAFRIVSVPPDMGHIDASLLPEDIRHYFDPDDAAMHTTDTIDYVIILGGAADLELDDGVSERVTTGDCVVQRGTRHAWRVVGDEALVLGAVLIGAERAAG